VTAVFGVFCRGARYKCLYINSVWLIFLIISLH